MQDNELFDVESRPGKMSGGYDQSAQLQRPPSSFRQLEQHLRRRGCADPRVRPRASRGYVAERDRRCPPTSNAPGMESAGPWNSSPPLAFL